MIPIVRPKDQAKRHKVISFGYTVTVEGEVPDSYRFQYYPLAGEGGDDEAHPGVVPAGFSASVAVDDSEIFFHTREGALGPEYQVAFGDVDQVLLEWTDDVDALWIESLQQLEDNNQLSEEALEFLDADPLHLFGIADPSTQKALEKASMVPMLKCLGVKPTLHEWFSYLNADPQVDKPFTWIIESFAEVELPDPWTSYKGVGSIVCYLNNESNETTWRHPFYDYFAQLLDHCRRASREEHIKLRINRMLWQYEAECAQDVANQHPLVSPKYVKLMGEIVEVDVGSEPYMVRTIKTFLKAFAQQYRLEEELDAQEVKWCLEIIDNERAKAQIAQELPFQEDPSDKVRPNEQAQLYCVECGVIASCFCPSCEDCLCDECFERLHSKGNRTTHVPNHLIQCCLCRLYPAKLQCTYTFGSYCHDCYTQKHVKTLPKFLDLRPVRIDYTKPYARIKRDLEKMKEAVEEAGEEFVPPRGKVGDGLKDVMMGDIKGKIMEGRGPGGRMMAPGEVDPRRELQVGMSRSAPPQSLMGEKWHAFYDMRGIKYFYNFETQESMRRPCDDVMTDDMYEVLEDIGILKTVLDPPASKLPAGQNTADVERLAKMEEVRHLATSKEPRLLETYDETYRQQWLEEERKKEEEALGADEKNLTKKKSFIQS